MTLGFLIGTLITGKLPKVSLYHHIRWDYVFTLGEYWYDKEAQSRMCPSQDTIIDAKRVAITEALKTIETTQSFKRYKKHINNTMPLFDEYGEIMGNQSLYGFISDLLNEHKNTL